MSERRLADELDASLETSMADPTAAFRGVTPRLAELLRIAGALRDLPSEHFKTRLGEELHAVTRAAGAAAAAGSAVRAFQVHDARAALGGLPEMSMRSLDSLDQCMLGVSRFATPSHWERHPAGDELLHLLAGEAEIVTLTDDGPQSALAVAGSAFICPQGLWHRVIPRSPVELLFATPGEGMEHSSAEDPRRGPRAAAAGPAAAAGAFAAHDLRALAAALPLLAIGPDTTEAQANAAFRTLARFNRQTLGLTRFSGQTPWERHPDGDELLYAFEGDVDVTLLTDAGPVRRRLHEGSIFVCPRGLWHRQLPRTEVTLLYATPTETTQISFADDPRINA